MSLADELAARAEAGLAFFSEERAAVYAKAQTTIEASGIADRALRVGDVAPEFELPDAYGSMVNSAELLQRGPMIVSFYRGSWCPFCNLELRALQRELDSVESAGATLVAISPNVPDESLALVEEHELTFPVLSDGENAVARLFNLVYEMDPDLVAFYKEVSQRAINEMNGSERWELPVPATYVIDRDGTIRYDFVDLNHRVRAEPADVVAVAAAL